MANEDKKLHGSTCALCGNKVKLLDRNYLHMLSDGPLCQKCHMTILQLLTQRRWWISEAEYMQVMQKNYSIRRLFITFQAESSLESDLKQQQP